MLNLSLKSKQGIFTILGLLGLSGLTVFYAEDMLAAYFDSTDVTSIDNQTVASGETCTPYAQDYMHSLQNEQEEVFTAGCGGLF